MRTFSELKSDVGNLLERTDSQMLSKIEQFLGQGYRYIFNFRPWFSLLRQQTFSSTAGLDYFITGPEVEMVVDLSQRQTPIVLAMQRYYALLNKNFDAMLLTTGNPSIAAPMGEVGVIAPMAANGTISMSSSSASDTTQYVRVSGYDANSVPINERVTLTGTSTASTTNTFSSREGFEPRFQKDSDTAGVITITAGAVTLARLAPTDRDLRMKKWKVWPAFQSSLTMYMTYKKRIIPLVNAEDCPEIECDNALIMFAYARALQEKRQFAKAKEVYGTRDIDGTPTPGSFLSELDALVAKEPQFGENFTDQFIPIVERDPVDYPPGQTGYRLWPR